MRQHIRPDRQTDGRVSGRTELTTTSGALRCQYFCDSGHTQPLLLYAVTAAILLLPTAKAGDARSQRPAAVHHENTAVRVLFTTDTLGYLEPCG